MGAARTTPSQHRQWPRRQHRSSRHKGLKNTLTPACTTMERTQNKQLLPPPQAPPLIQLLQLSIAAAAAAAGTACSHPSSHLGAPRSQPSSPDSTRSRTHKASFGQLPLPVPPTRLSCPSAGAIPPLPRPQLLPPSHALPPGVARVVNTHGRMLGALSQVRLEALPAGG
eukprot:349893-Chlamydomonas_euryale.AAC.2